jgi:hypothetical protein
MRKRRWYRRLVWILASITYWLALVLSITVAAVLRADKAWISSFLPWLSPFFGWLTNTAPVTFPISTVAVAVAATIKSRILPSKVDAAIKTLLDDFRARAFPVDDPAVTHRVTLFRHRRWRSRLLLRLCLPWTGCLVPYERAGEFKLSSSTYFLAPKNDPDRSEGFAGRVFKNNRCEYIAGLPELDARTAKGIRKQYADDTGTPSAWIDKRMRKNYIFPRSFWGIPVEVEGGIIWGVFLIDSRASELAGKDQLKEIYNPLGAVLSKLLAKGTSP